MSPKAIRLFQEVLLEKDLEMPESAYRTNGSDEKLKAEIVVVGEYINGGRLSRARSKGDTGHDCNVPGWFARWRKDVHFGDVWTCTCGTEWTWTKWDKTYHDGDCANGTRNVWFTSSKRWKR